VKGGLVLEPNRWHPIALLTVVSAMAAQIFVIMAVLTMLGK